MKENDVFRIAKYRGWRQLVSRFPSDYRIVHLVNRDISFVARLERFVDGEWFAVENSNIWYFHEKNQ